MQAVRIFFLVTIPITVFVIWYGGTDAGTVRMFLYGAAFGVLLNS